ncbi:MAG: DinB family protein [Bacteroidota bacterium]
MNRELSASYISEIRKISEEIRTKFSSLSHDQLNFKPAADKWSIAQCLQHIMHLNTAYFPRIEENLKKAEEKNRLANKAFRANLLTRLTIKALQPGNKSRFKAYEVFKPVQSDIPVTLFEEFEKHHEKLIELIRSSEKYNWNKVKIASPANRFVRFQLGGLFLLMIVHAQRHILQAEKVKEMLDVRC